MAATAHVNRRKEAKDDELSLDLVYTSSNLREVYVIHIIDKRDRHDDDSPRRIWNMYTKDHKKKTYNCCTLPVALAANTECSSLR